MSGVDVEAVILTLASIVRTDNGNLHPEINALLADAEEALGAVADLIEAVRDARRTHGFITFALDAALARVGAA